MPRTNRPDGISQENRAHPFFILLRNLAAAEQQQGETATRDLVVLYIATGVQPILWIIATFFEPSIWLITLFMTVLSIERAYQRYDEWKMWVGRCIYREVDHMIYSNDYQSAQLNYEEVIRKCCDAAATATGFRQLQETMKHDALFHTLSSIAFLALAIFTRGGFLSGL